MSRTGYYVVADLTDETTVTRLRQTTPTTSGNVRNTHVHDVLRDEMIAHNKAHTIFTRQIAWSIMYPRG